MLCLAAAAVMLAAAAVVGSVYAAAIAEQDDQQDDPAQIATAKAIVIHNEYLRKITGGDCRSFQGIPQRNFCYSFDWPPDFL